MTFIGILIVALLLIVGVFAFQNSADDTQPTIIEEGFSAIEEAELLKERIENRAGESIE